MIVTSSGDDADRRARDPPHRRRTEGASGDHHGRAKATCNAVRVLQEGKLEMIALQDFF